MHTCVCLILNIAISIIIPIIIIQDSIRSVQQHWIDVLLCGRAEVLHVMLHLHLHLLMLSV